MQTIIPGLLHFLYIGIRWCCDAMGRKEGVVPVGPLQDVGSVAAPMLSVSGSWIPNKGEVLGVQTGPAQEQSQGRPWS